MCFVCTFPCFDWSKLSTKAAEKKNQTWEKSIGSRLNREKENRLDCIQP